MLYEVITNTLKIITDGDSSTGDKIELDGSVWTAGNVVDGYTEYTGVSSSNIAVTLLIEQDNVDIV